MLTRLIKSSLCLFLLVGCAKPYPPPRVDPAFEEVLQSYKTDLLAYRGIVYFDHVSIVFADIHTNTNPAVGYCYMGKTQLIEVDRHFWDAIDQDQKTVLLYHELGHCDLMLDHTDGLNIMNPYLINGWMFANNRDLFLRMLFLEGK